MKSLNLTFIAVLISIGLNAQHRISLNFTKDASYEMRLVESSHMFDGRVNNNCTEMLMLDAGKDGEIVFNLEHFNSGLSNEDITMSLVNESNTDEYFTIRFHNQEFSITQKYDGVEVPELVVTEYNIGDKIKIVRCNTQIIYFINSTLITTFELVNGNDFSMLGKVQVLNGANVAFESFVEFITSP